VPGGCSSEERIVICNPTTDVRPVPVLCLKERHKDEIMASTNNQGIAISCTKAKLNEDNKLESKTITSTFVIKTNGDGTIDVLDKERSLADIGKVFSFMHTPIAKSSHNNMSSSDIPVLSPREYLELRMNTLSTIRMVKR
jgi:hypothetical protein